MKLSQLAVGHDNNFNLIRFIAAYSVLVSHSFPIVNGPGLYEPFARIGYSLGGIAVDVFFLTSGFLVTASMLRLRDLRAFFQARAWRIVPALVVMVVLLALCMGPLVTTLPLRDYFLNHLPYQFMVNDVLLLFGIEQHLPGVFHDLPFRKAVNGPLWTLPLEVRCYLSVMLLWWLAGKFAADRPRFLLRASLAVAATTLLLFWGSKIGIPAGVPWPAWLDNWHVFRLFFMFFCGASYYQLRDRIPMRWPLAAVFAAAVAIAVALPSLFFWLYPLCLGYLVLWFAYVPKGPLLAFNRLGDYSYGTYIYAWPMQQLAIWLHRSATPWDVMWLATAMTLPLAMLSWHLVEAPALARKRRRLKAFAG